MASSVCSAGFPSTRDADLLGRVQQRAARGKSLEHLAPGESLSELGLFSLGKRQFGGSCHLCKLLMGERWLAQTLLSGIQWKDKRQWAQMQYRKFHVNVRNCGWGGWVCFSCQERSNTKPDPNLCPLKHCQFTSGSLTGEHVSRNALGMGLGRWPARAGRQPGSGAGVAAALLYACMVRPVPSCWPLPTTTS